MRVPLNQPFRVRGMGDFTGDVPEFSAKTASPPATGPGIMDTIIGGISNLFGAVTAQVPTVTQRLLYGSQGPYTMYQGGIPSQVLAPKASIPTEYLLLGGGILALLILSKKRGR